MKTTHRLLVASITVVGACAQDIGDDPVDDAGPSPMADGGTVASGPIANTDLGDGVTETRIDGSAAEGWILFDFETASEVTGLADPWTEGTWDVAFQRYHYRLNGGEGGAGEAAVALLDGASFAEVEQAPEGEYLQDAQDSDDEDELPDFAISAGEDPWWDYDPMLHTLTPKERVYVVRSDEGNYYALEVLDYYHPDSGESGYPAFRWKSVDAPEGTAPTPPGMEVDASSREEWVYLTLDGEQVVVSDESASDAWDLAFQRTGIRTSSGVSGPGLGGAREAEQPWDSISTSTTVGFSTDTMVPVPGPPGSGEMPGNAVLDGWYDYNPATHAVTPGDRFYIIRGASGDYAKLRINAWEDGVFHLDIEPIEREVETRTTMLDASDSEEWVYFSFRLGEVVSVEEPTLDLAWDVAFSRTLTRTNSGTSGGGMGGAGEASSAELDEIQSDVSEIVEDTEVPLPGPPGSGTVSGNDSLGGWYDYDTMTRVVTPGARAYVVHTADGGLVKIRITGWDDGMLTFEWAYAGAGQADFGGAS